MKIFVTGASGFVGSQIVTDLLKAGHQVTCCVRNPDYARRLFPSCKIVYCDFIKNTQENLWSDHLKDIDVVINTVGIFYHPQKKIIWATHFDAPKALFDAAVTMRVKKIIHISALGIDKSDVDYAQSKKAADDYLLTLPIPAIILRPSLIYGRGSYGGTSLFRGLVGLPGFIPLPGKGEQQFQPIYLPDLSRAIIQFVDLPAQKSQIFSAVNPKKIDLKDLLVTLRNWLGFPRAWLIAVPLFFIRLGSYFGNFFPNSMVNTTAYKMLMQNNITSAEATKEFSETIGFVPQDFKSGLFQQPSSVQDRWHSQLFFVKPLLQLALAFLWIFTAMTSAFLFPKTTSYHLLGQVGIHAAWQPLFLYGASFLNALLGLALLLNFQVRKVCLLQMGLIVIYTLIISWKIPFLWLEPFGAITKNIPLLVAIYILYILESNR